MKGMKVIYFTVLSLFFGVRADTAFNNTYVYLRNEIYNVAELVHTLSAYDNNQESPIQLLKHYIADGNRVVLHDEMLCVLAYAGTLLRDLNISLSEVKRQQLLSTIDDFVEVIMQGWLDINRATTFVNGNVTMHNSIGMNLGNITKETNSFIHNFGTDNTFVGVNAGNFTLNEQSGAANTGFGVNALNKNTNGRRNTAVGYSALAANTEGRSNTAVGANALLSNTTGNDNVAIGKNAIAYNVTGSRNTALGFEALNANNGDDNTAVGYGALKKNTTGISNTALGVFSLQNNISGSDNTVAGNETLFSHTIGSNNTAIGSQALRSLTTGDYNTAVGQEALLQLVNGTSNTAIGAGAGKKLIEGNENIFVGFEAGVTLTKGSNNIYIGSPGLAQEDGVIRIGTQEQSNCFIPSILNNQLTEGSAITINPLTAEIGIMTSSRRFKRNINDMKDNDSARIYDLNPVKIMYMCDENATEQYSLIAEDVDMVFPNLVVKDHDSKPLSVRYDILPVLLIKEMQKQQNDITDQEYMINDHERKINILQQMIMELSI